LILKNESGANGKIMGQSHVFAKRSPIDGCIFRLRARARFARQPGMDGRQNILAPIFRKE
jgi:hypothetical protein